MSPMHPIEKRMAKDMMLNVFFKELQGMIEVPQKP